MQCRTRSRGLWLLLSLAGISLHSGCGSKYPVECQPVRGQVLVGDKPLAEARVIFHPLSEQPVGVPKPMGVCDEEGRFELSTFDVYDGAPAGQYAITVEYRELKYVGEEEIRAGRDLVPPEFGDLKKTILKYEVVLGENEVPPLQLIPPEGGAPPNETP